MPNVMISAVLPGDGATRVAVLGSCPTQHGQDPPLATLRAGKTVRFTCNLAARRASNAGIVRTLLATLGLLSD